MSGWAKKRFWTEVTVAQAADGFAMLLDGRGVKTPAKAALGGADRGVCRDHRRGMACAGRHIDPTSMPATRAANAAIDKVRGQMTEVPG